MSRSPRSLLFRSTGLLVAFVLGVGVLGHVVGCKTATSDPESLPPNKLKALVAADAMINEGDDLVERGTKLKAQGKGGEDLIKQGGEKKAAGEKMKLDASAIKD